MEEAFFVPCTRMRDIMRAWNIDREDGDYLFPERSMNFEEVELRAGAGNSAVDFLHPNFTFDEVFWQLARRKIIWMGPHTFVNALNDIDLDDTDVFFDFRDELALGYECLFAANPANNVDTVGEDNKYILEVVHSGSVTETTTNICDYVLQLMITKDNIILMDLEIHVLPSVSIDALSLFLNNSRDSGGTIRFGYCDLSFQNFSMDHLRDYMNVLEVSAGPHHQIVLRSQTNWSQELTATVATFLQRCQCAIVLICSQLCPPILDALRGNCDIVELHLTGEVPDTAELFRALAENKSLVRLDFDRTLISDKNWTVLCHSLSKHSKLESLTLRDTFPGGVDQHSNENRKTRRTSIFLKMLQVNTVLRELDAIRFGVEPQHREFDERILTDVIQPYFRHLSHVRAFGQSRGPKNAQMVALALSKVDDSPTLAWMIVCSSIPTIMKM
jgi:hypothetical protein